VCMVQFRFGLFMIHRPTTVTKKVVGVFVRFRAPCGPLAKCLCPPTIRVCTIVGKQDTLISRGLDAHQLGTNHSL
jgi:hypothetical protein